MSITTCTFAEGGPTVGTNAVTNYKIDGGTAVELDNPGDMGNEAEAGVTDDYPLLKASSAINVEMIGNGRHVETAAFCSATASAVSTRGTILASMLLPTRTLPAIFADSDPSNAEPMVGASNQCGTRPERAGCSST